MGEKERQKFSCAVGRDGTGDVILVRNRLMYVSWDATWDNVMCSLCNHQGPCGCLLSGPSPKTMLISKGYNDVNGLCCHLVPWWCLACATSNGHVGVRGPTTTGGYADVHVLCYHQKPCGCLWSGLQPEVVLMSKSYAELSLLLARNRTAVSALTALYFWWYCVHQREGRTIARISMTEVTEGNPREVSMKIWYLRYSRNHRP